MKKILTREALKIRFKAGAIPEQEDFQHLFDSFVHRVEDLGLSDTNAVLDLRGTVLKAESGEMDALTIGAGGIRFPEFVGSGDRLLFTSGDGKIDVSGKDPAELLVGGNIGAGLRWDAQAEEIEVHPGTGLELTGGMVQVEADLVLDTIKVGSAGTRPRDAQAALDVKGLLYTDRLKVNELRVLQFDGGGNRMVYADSNGVLQDSNDLGKGLDFDGNALRLAIGNSLEYVGNEVEVKAGAGLKTSSAGLRLDIGTGLRLDSSGKLHAAAPGNLQNLAVEGQLKVGTTSALAGEVLVYGSVGIGKSPASGISLDVTGQVKLEKLAVGSKVTFSNLSGPGLVAANANGELSVSNIDLSATLKKSDIGQGLLLDSGNNKLKINSGKGLRIATAGNKPLEVALQNGGGIVFTSNSPNAALKVAPKQTFTDATISSKLTVGSASDPAVGAEIFGGINMHGTVKLTAIQEQTTIPTYVLIVAANGEVARMALEKFKTHLTQPTK